MELKSLSLYIVNEPTPKKVSPEDINNASSSALVFSPRRQVLVLEHTDCPKALE